VLSVKRAGPALASSNDVLHMPGMRGSDVLLKRLRTQRVACPEAQKFASVREAVHWMGAVQSQDYLAAKWAIGQRVRGCTEVLFDAAYSRGEILRTHVMRPTWHFVAPEDLRWMLALTAPRVNALRAHYNRRQGLDGPTFARSYAVIRRTLRNGNHSTRDELGEVLDKEKIGGGPERRGHILLGAELEGIVCSGPLRGKAHTYALVEERAPTVTRLPSREEALSELARRFFLSHGPATLKDFAWWSGLTMADARAGIEASTPALAREVIGEKTYFFDDRGPGRVRDDGAVHLLPNFDEYAVAYVDRETLLDVRHRSRLGEDRSPLFENLVVRRGLIVGTWQRKLTKKTVSVATRLFVRPGAPDRRALAEAIQAYARFLGREAI
jgi:hypothetical protein